MIFKVSRPPCHLVSPSPLSLSCSWSIHSALPSLTQQFLLSSLLLSPFIVRIPVDIPFLWIIWSPSCVFLLFLNFTCWSALSFNLVLLICKAVYNSSCSIFFKISMEINEILSVPRFEITRQIMTKEQPGAELLLLGAGEYLTSFYG